jgi:CHAT domain-containing protein
VHAELVEDRPELTSLVFSRFDREGQRIDGRLFMHEISSLSIPCDLIILSACNTALGKPIRGEGLVGLTRAVFLAGASRALVTLWNVDDEATAELMIHFHRGLLVEGFSPGQALRQAQLKLPTLDQRWQAPYFWAGFVLQGDWRWPSNLAAKP